jgi:hypothetical protein
MAALFRPVRLGHGRNALIGPDCSHNVFHRTSQPLSGERDPESPSARVPRDFVHPWRQERKAIHNFPSAGSGSTVTGGVCCVKYPLRGHQTLAYANLGWWAMQGSIGPWMCVSSDRHEARLLAHAKVRGQTQMRETGVPWRVDLPAGQQHKADCG